MFDSFVGCVSKAVEVELENFFGRHSHIEHHVSVPIAVFFHISEQFVVV